MKMSKDIVCIADTQITKASDLSHLEALAEYVWEYKPTKIVHIGDNYDFESLSYYASALESEGRRLVDDLKSGTEALELIPKYIERRNLISKKKKYSPQFIFITGNHEERLNRMVKSNPHLVGMVDLPKMIEDAGWTYYRFLEPHWHGNIAFIHYLPNPLSGKPIGGSVENKLNKHPHSFVQGHIQQFQFARRQTLDGTPHFGVVAGVFSQEDEDYRGISGNTEIRGFTHYKSFTNRFDKEDFDVEFVSLERLLSNYGINKPTQ